MALENGKNNHFDKLEAMGLDERVEFLNNRLKETTVYAYENSAATKAIFQKAGLKPDLIRKVEDLERLPIIRKADLIEMQKQNLPYGGFLMIPEDNIERIFISPGPVYEPLHTSTIHWFGRSFWAAGFRKADIVINTFTYHLSPAGILFHEGLRDCGATPIASGTGHTEMQIKTIQELKVTAFVGTPSYLLSLLGKAEEMGLDVKKDLNLKRAWFTGEMLTSSTRKTLEKDYGLETFQAYGVTETGGCLAYECEEKNGLHLMSDEYVVEIVDPKTGKQLPEGEVGEVVVTPVNNKTWGLMRFGTGDLSCLKKEKCSCGRTAYKLSGIIGRVGDAVKVRGMFVVGKQTEDVFKLFPEIVRYQIKINRPATRDELTFVCVHDEKEFDAKKLSDELNKKFQDRCLLKADHIEFVPASVLANETKLMLDERKWD